MLNKNIDSDIYLKSERKCRYFTMISWNTFRMERYMQQRVKGLQGNKNERLFDDKYKNIELKRRLINLISEISEFKGKLAAYQEQNPDIFNSLEKLYHYIT